MRGAGGILAHYLWRILTAVLPPPGHGCQDRVEEVCIDCLKDFRFDLTALGAQLLQLLGQVFDKFLDSPR